MSNIVKHRLQKTFKKIEDNFQTLANNKDIQKVIKEMKSLREKRAKQIESMLNQSLSDIKKSYKKEVKAMEKFLRMRSRKLNKFSIVN